MAKPTHRVKAKSKSTGQTVEIGVVFKSDKGTNLILKPGTKIQVVQQYNKETKTDERLDTPIVITADGWYINIWSTEPADEHPVTTQAKKTFKPQAGVDDDCPF